MLEHGFDVYPVSDGEIHRFKGPEDKKLNGWYVYHGDHGAFGNWRTNLTVPWRSKNAQIDQKEYRKIVQRERAERIRAEAIKHSDAAKQARLIWAESVPATEHHYLTKKQVQPYGIYLRGNSLVIPIRNNSKELTSLQFISKGKKRFLPGGEIIGCYHVLGNKPTDRLLIVEGYATGASLHEATGSAVAVAFYADNLKPVAKVLREKFPDIQIILCADNDAQTEGNPGVTKATEAAQEINGLLAIPKDEGDFNDTATNKGLGIVQQIIDAATTPPRTNDSILKDAFELDDIAYDQRRDALAKELGIRAATLDNERKKARKESVEDDAPILVLNTSEPCADPVDGAELLSAIVTAINEYLVLPDGAAEAMALWIMHTYCHDAAWISPLLVFSSPTKQCGKTTCLTLLSSIADKPLTASNCTAPVLFRGIEEYGPTLFLDEADTFLKDNEEMRGVINSGHNRSSAQVLRLVGDSYDVKPFSTWCPKAIAAIGKLPPTLMDRSIVIVMQRKKKIDKVKRLRGDKLHEFESLRRQCVRWALDNLEAIKATDPDVPEYLGDRAQDNWRTLLAIADVAGWTDVTVAAIEKLTPKKAEDDDTGVELLADIRKIFGDRICVSSAEIVGALNEMEERLWPGFYRGKGISPQGVAKILGRYGIKPKLHDVLGKKRGYERKQFLDVWVRYLPDPDDSTDLGVPPLQTSNGGACGDFLGVTSELSVTPGNMLEPPPDKGCNTGTPKSGVSPEKSEETPDIAEAREDASDDLEPLHETYEEYQDIAKDQRGDNRILI